jgi:hypothetical protein
MKLVNTLSLLSLALTSTLHARDKEPFELLQRSLIQAMAEKEMCKSKRCGERPGLFNLEEFDRSYNQRITQIRKYNTCILDCDGKSVPVALDKYILLKNESQHCEKYLPTPVKLFFQEKHLAQYNQDVSKNEFYTKNPQAEAGIIVKLEKRHKLCKDVLDGKFDKEMHASYLKQLKSCEVSLKKHGSEPGAIKVLDEINTFLNQRKTPTRTLSSLGSDVIMVDKKIKLCNDQLASINSNIQTKSIDQTSRAKTKTQEYDLQGGGHPLTLQPLLDR